MRVLLAVLFVGIVGCGGDSSPPGEGAVPTPKSSQGKTDKPPAKATAADAALKNLGAEIDRNEQGEIVKVNLIGTNAGLEHLKGLANLKTLFLADTQVTAAELEHLKGMTNLQTLYLAETQITDAGLVHLKGLTKLEYLNLGRTKITDAGLEHLKGLSKLQALYLWSTEITDTGLLHLKGLTKLGRLDLLRTNVTDAGVADLQQALPNCKISK